ncbi:hypothetical protein Btru_070416 [Bulinus truncatus]|nr:hypothetical protein Btru_070416 [Bulinus truncatus]
MAGDFKMFRDTQFTTLTRVGTNYNALSDFMTAVLRYHSYHNVVMFYDGEGQTEVMYKLCHVVMNALHEQLKESVAHSSYKIYNHPIKYTSKEDFNDIFRSRIGTKYAGK